MTQLGDFYRRGGYGIEKDKDQCLYWYKKAADRDIFDAQYLLGILYHYGDLFKKNYQQALMWYIKAAENKYVYYENYLDVQKLQIIIGDMYKNGGHGIYENYEEALS